ncbi:MAG TPA: agmatine deiminase family protein [Blastocatellia bacterium]|nr:agmatine deiminase family protein [Blastocatellia bacterium]
MPLRELSDHLVSVVGVAPKVAQRRGARDAERMQGGRKQSNLAGSPSGFRMPAEWEPHDATWIGWPHNTTDWPGKFAVIPWVYGEIVKKLAPGEIVRIIVNDKRHEEKARRVLLRSGVDLTRIEFFRFPTNRGWTRDFGPMFVKRDATPAEVAIVRFRFNAWAKYPDWKKDDAIPERASKALGCRLLSSRAGNLDFVLEGGSLDVNGSGTLMTTEECLLDQQTQVRNPGLSRAETEAALRERLGVTNVLWLGRGIEGDDTHGHVDDLCRFVGERTVVLCNEDNPGDYNYRVCAENRERLEGMKLEDGSKIEVIPLPMPAPLVFSGRRLPASYANFYISNAAVLVPTFNDPNDRLALGVLSVVITDRPVVGIHAVDLVWGLGTLHCLTQQQPSSLNSG